MSTPGTRFKLLRVKSGLSQRDAATVAGVSYSSITKWESDTQEQQLDSTNPRHVFAVKKFTDHCGVDESYIWLGDKTGSDLSFSGHLNKDELVKFLVKVVSSASLEADLRSEARDIILRLLGD